MSEVTRDVLGAFPGRHEPVPMRLRTSSSDPLTLTIDFYLNYEGEDPGEPVTWVMALDLLRAAIGRHSGIIGEGDVIFNRASTVREVSLDLNSPEGNGQVLIPRQGVRKFLDAAERVDTEVTREAFFETAYAEIDTFLEEQSY